jgi:hypothetical protein
MTGKALAAIAAAAVVLLAAGSAQPSAQAPRKSLPVLGVVAGALHQSLVQLDRQKLRPLRGRKVDLDYATYSWAFSPDKRLLAIGRYDGTQTGMTDGKGFVRIVNPYQMKVVGEIPLGRGTLQPQSMAWVAPDRLVAVAWSCCPASTEPDGPLTGEDSDLVVVDPVAGRLVERRPLAPGFPIAVRATPGQLLVLLRIGEGIGPVELLAVGPDGTIRSVVLDRIEGGTGRTEEGFTGVDPGLAVQPDGRRAFVFSAGGTVAEVDLASLAVTYHSLTLGRRAPAVRAKRFEGSFRRAAMLPNGFIALSGFDVRPYVDGDGNEQIGSVPAGLELVDPSRWNAELIDADADSFAVAGDNVLATGGIRASGGKLRGGGLTAYTLWGKHRFKILKRRSVAVDYVYGNRAFVNLEPNVLHVVDLHRKRVTGRRNAKTFPWLIVPDGPATAR